MKKTLLSLCLALASLAGMAQTNYNETLVVSVDGESAEPIPASITVTKNDDGTCDFSLLNFKLNESMAVGTIYLKGVEMEDHETYTGIATTQSILIEEGDDENVDFWLGPMLGEVPIVLEGKFTETALYAKIDISMVVGGELQVINVVVGDVNTSINQTAVSAPAAQSQAVYTLGGIRVANAWNASLPKGVYIVGGKKVIK